MCLLYLLNGRERERERVCECVIVMCLLYILKRRERERERVCVCVIVRERVRTCVILLKERERERDRVRVIVERVKMCVLYFQKGR